jgi:hypothetical protein
MLPFRVVVIDEHRTTTTVIVSLERSPDVGATIEPPHGALGQLGIDREGRILLASWDPAYSSGEGGI